VASVDIVAITKLFVVSIVTFKPDASPLEVYIMLLLMSNICIIKDPVGCILLGFVRLTLILVGLVEISDMTIILIVLVV